MNITWQEEGLEPQAGGATDIIVHTEEDTHGTPCHHYYPTVMMRNGTQWTLWLEYSPADQSEKLQLTPLTQNGEAILVRNKVHSCLSPTGVVLPDGTLGLFWIEGPDFVVYGCQYDTGTGFLSQPVPLSIRNTRCNHLVQQQEGEKLWLAWEAWDADASCSIHLRTWSSQEGWSPVAMLTPPKACAYWPTMVTANQALWVAWSTSNSTWDGYDCYVAVYPEQDSRFEAAQVYLLNNGIGGNFHVYPFLQRNNEDQVWVCWKANTELEYSDLVNQPGNSEFGYIRDAKARRRRNIWWKYCNAAVLRLSIQNGSLVRHRLPSTDAGGKIDVAGHCHYPTLLPCCDGVPGLMARRLTKNNLFETFEAYYDGQKWSTPKTLHPSLLQVGRNANISVAYDPAVEKYSIAQHVKRIQPDDCFWGGAHPEYSSLISTTTWKFGKTKSRTAALDGLEPLGPVPWELAAAPVPTRSNKQRPFWGNIHVHSDLSGCRRDTQQTVDFNYRWGKDLMEADFLALTDHAEDMFPYDWKWTKTMACFYNFPGHFVSILAYEWTMNDFGPSAHSGHCNVLLRLPIAQAWGCHSEVSNTLPKLWQLLKPKQAMTIPHHTATFPYWRDFTLHNADFERLIEVQQDRRGNYEYSGCPGEYDGTVVPLQDQEHNRPGSFVVDALRKGYQLGFCTGGDHMGISMTGVFGSVLESESIFDALYNRKCYGATGAKIQLSVSASLLHQSTRQFRMGERIHNPTRADILFKVQVAGTAALESVDLISDSKVVASFSQGLGQSAEVNFVIRGREQQPYYYVRIAQADSHMAWSSPIWIES